MSDLVEQWINGQVDKVGPWRQEISDELTNSAGAAVDRTGEVIQDGVNAAVDLVPNVGSAIKNIVPESVDGEDWGTRAVEEVVGAPHVPDPVLKQTLEDAGERLKFGTATAINALDTATFGALSSDYNDNILGPFASAADSATEWARDQGLGANLLGDIGGSLTKYTGPGFVGNLLTKYGLRTTPRGNILDFGKRALVGNAYVGAVESAIFEAVGGPTNLEEIFKAAAGGGAAGVVGGVLLGEALPAAWNTVTGRNARARIIADLIDEGDFDSPYALQNLQETVNSMGGSDGILDVSKYHRYDGELMEDRIAQSLAKSRFPGADPLYSGQTPADAMQIRDLNNTAAKIYTEADQEVAYKVKEVTGDHKSNFAKYREQRDELQEANDFYSYMKDFSKPGKGADKPINAPAVMKDIEAQAAAIGDGGKPYSDFLASTKEELQMHEMIRDAVRAREVSPSGQAGNIPVHDPIHGMQGAPDIGYGKAGYLLEARDKIAAYSVPGVLLAGNEGVASKAQAVAARKYLKILDDQIEKHFNGYKGSKEEIASTLRTRDLYHSAQMLYTQRANTIDPTSLQANDNMFGEDIEEFYRGLSEKDQETFSLGFKSSIAKGVDSRSAMRELASIFGPPDAVREGLTADMNMGNVRVMETILGKEDTAELMNILTDTRERSEAAHRLQQVLRKKKRAPGEVVDIMRAADNAMIGSLAMPEGVKLTSTGGMTALGRASNYVKRSPRNTMRMVDFINAHGQVAADKFNKYAVDFAKSGGRNRGQIGASIMDGTLEGDEAAIMDYLNSLTGSGDEGVDDETLLNFTK